MSVKFDNADDLINCGTSDTLFPENAAVTVSAWILATSEGQGPSGRIICRSITGGGTDGIHFQFEVTAALHFFITGTTNTDAQSANNAVTFGQWQHVLVTWDGSTTATNIHIYVNGAEVSYVNQSNGLLPNDTSAFTTYIGNRGNGARCFDGRIAEVAVWNSVLSAGAIATLYNSGSMRGSAGLPLTVGIGNLKAYWPLSDFADGTSANSLVYKDKSGAGLDGTGSWGANASGLTSFVEQGFMSSAAGMWGY